MKRNLPCRRISNNLCRHSTVKFMSIASHSYVCNTHSNFLLQNILWKSYNNNDNIIIIKNHFTMEKADKHYLSKMIRSIPRLINHVDSIYPLYDIIKMSVYLCIWFTITVQSWDKQTCPNWGKFYKILYFSKCSSSTTTRKGWKTVTIQRSLRKQEDKWNVIWGVVT